MKAIKRTTIRQATTAGAGDMAATGTFSLQGYGSPFKVLLNVLCANAHVFSVTFRKATSTGEVVGECAVNSAVTTPQTFEYDFDPTDAKVIHWTVVGTAPAGAISLWIQILEEMAKLK